MYRNQVVESEIYIGKIEKRTHSVASFCNRQGEMDMCAKRTVAFWATLGFLLLMSVSSGAQEWTTSGNNIFNLNSGNVGIGTNSPTAGLHIATNGAASTPGLKLDGTWFLSGNSTTNKPQLLIEPSGTTSTNWKPTGTGLGLNMPTGWVADFIAAQQNGVNRFELLSTGKISLGLTDLVMDPTTHSISIGANFANQITLNGTQRGSASYSFIFNQNDPNANEQLVQFQALSGSPQFNLSNTGIVAVSGGNGRDITTISGTSGSGLTIQPATRTSTSATAGSLALIGGNESGASSTGGSILVDSGTGTSVNGAVLIGTANSRSISISNSLGVTTIAGNVGIGTALPGQRLEVNGGIKLTAGSGGTILFPDGTAQSTAWTGAVCGGDYAESVQVAGGRSRYEPGDVLVIDPAAPGAFMKSAERYSTMVAGIYSTKPGLIGRRYTTPDRTGAEVPMAMVGIVPTKVSAENGAIKAGDLLVTSATAGYAMKGTDRGQMFGAIVGKALGSLDSGTGVIEVLVSLQ